MSLLSTDEPSVEAVAKALHDRWQNGHRPWDETCDKLPLQAETFRQEARLAIATIRSVEEGLIQQLRTTLTDIRKVAEGRDDLSRVDRLAQDALALIG